MILDSRMSSSRDSRHAYMQGSITREQYMQDLISRADFTLIQSPPNLYSGCGSAAKVGSRTFDFHEFIGRLNDDNINNFQQKELLEAFTKVKSGKLVISRDEQNDIYEYIRDNSMAQDASIALYSGFLETALQHIKVGTTPTLLWVGIRRSSEEIRNKFNSGKSIYDFLQYIVDNEVSPTTLKSINDLLFEKLGIRLPEKTSDLPKKSEPKITKVGKKKPSKKKGGSRKTRRSKSNRQRNKTYRR